MVLQLNSNQVFDLADIMLHDIYPNTEPLIEQPFHVKAEWIKEAEKAIAGYNIINNLLDRGVIKSMPK